MNSTTNTERGFRPGFSRGAASLMVTVNPTAQHGRWAGEAEVHVGRSDRDVHARAQDVAHLELLLTAAGCRVVRQIAQAGSGEDPCGMVAEPAVRALAALRAEPTIHTQALSEGGRTGDISPGFNRDDVLEADDLAGRDTTGLEKKLLDEDLLAVFGGEPMTDRAREHFRANGCDL